MFLIFLLALIIHELGHILIAWYFSKNIPKVRFSLETIKIYPKTVLNNREKSIFLGVPIILGMFTIYPFFHIFPLESSLAMIGYLISCGKDFYNMVVLEIERIKK